MKQIRHSARESCLNVYKQTEHMSVRKKKNLVPKPQERRRHMDAEAVKSFPGYYFRGN